MAKKKSKKIKMVESHEAQTIGFLQRSGVPAKDIKKLIHEIHELIEFGGVSIPEAHQEVLENWHQRTALAGLRELEAELKKQTADVAKAQKRAIASAKATTKENEAAARLAAKAETKAAKTAAVTVPPVAEPAGPTVMPRPRSPEPPRPESGIRKALGKSLTKEEQEYQKTLDKLRSDAANTVQENPDLFGSGRYDQTIDQSTLYQLYEGVVELGESAAKARKAEDKQRLLASLNAYKKIVMSLAKEGSDKEKQLANKLLEIIASIEKKLSKGSGEIGRLKENLKDWAQRIPENLAAKIPLVGGFMSGMLQRKRERKEGEEYQKQDILAASSRGIGSSSLFGKIGGMGGMGGMSESAVEGISTGGSDLGDPETTETGSAVPSGSLSGGETIRTLQSILVQVVDIKSLIQGQTDSEAGLDAEEASRETADKEHDFLNKMKGLFGGGKGGKGGAGAGAESGGGIMKVVEDIIGGGIVAKALKWLAGAAVATMAATYAATAAVALGAVAATVGTGLGTGVAFGINKLIDLAVGNAPGDGLADYQFRAETYGFGAQAEKQKELEMQSNAAAANEEKANTTENKKKRAVDASADPRSLSASVLSGALTPKEASDALNAYQQLNPDDENISQYKKDIDVAYTKTTKMAAGSTVQQRKLKTKSEALETETQYAGDIVLGEKETILDASKQKDQKTVVGGVRDPVTGLFKYGGEPQDYKKQMITLGYLTAESSGKTFEEGAAKEAAVWKAEQDQWDAPPAAAADTVPAAVTSAVASNSDGIAPAAIAPAAIAPAAVVGTIQPKYYPNTNTYEGWDPEEAEADKKWHASPAGQAVMRSMDLQREAQKTDARYEGDEPAKAAGRAVMAAEIEASNLRGKTKREEAIEFAAKQTAKRKIREDAFRADPAKANFPKNRDIDMPMPIDFGAPDPNWTPEYTEAILKKQKRLQEMTDEIDYGEMTGTGGSPEWRERDAIQLDAVREDYKDLSAQPEVKGAMTTTPTAYTAVGRTEAELQKFTEDFRDKHGKEETGSGSPQARINQEWRTTHTTINNNSGGASTRNNDPTVKAVERGSM